MATGGSKPSLPSERADEITNVVDSYTNHLLKTVFCWYDPGPLEKKLSSLQTIESEIDEILRKPLSGDVSASGARGGILGPDLVSIDITKNTGSVIVDADRLGATGLGNFSTLRANVCVFRGKWMYEVMLGSKGVMQLGWCTNNCKFSQEEGVGDTVTSYSYDGNRLRKWNKTTDKYGEMWLTGDVIGCCIDCDQGTITFHRNGNNMGTAFTNVSLGAEVAYFPAFSVSQNESIRVNFGGVPFRFPVDGYLPMQETDEDDLREAEILFGFLEKLLPVVVELEMGEMYESPSKTVKYSHKTYSAKCAHAIISAHIFHKLAPLLKSPYIVDRYLIALLLKFHTTSERSFGEKFVEVFLSSLWTFLQEFEIKLCLGHTILSLLSAFRFLKDDQNFTVQKTYLRLITAVLRHEKTRRYALENILFDKIKMPLFFNVKVPDDPTLESIIPDPWWDVPTKKKEDTAKPVDQASAETRRLYYKSCDSLHDNVLVLEKLQVELLKLLLLNDKEDMTASSRYIFLTKFRKFLKNHSSQRTAAHLAQYVPQPVLLCFFHRFLAVFRQLWTEESGNHGEIPHVPVKRFCDESVDFFDHLRLGGLISHLRKDNKGEVTLAQKSLMDEEHTMSLPSTSRKVDDYEATLEKLGISDEPSGSPAAKSKSKMTFLLEILDGLVLLYNTSAHKQLMKMAGLRDVIGEYIGSLHDTEQKMARLQPDHEQYAEIKQELERAREVFSKKVVEQSRHMAWVISVIFTEEKQRDIFWLLKSTLLTLQTASKQGAFFLFVPEYYVEVGINAFNVQRSCFYPTIDYEHLEGFEHVQEEFMNFLAVHFSDTRIVSGDTKDSIVQTLACSMCYKPLLRALEKSPRESLQKMARALLAPYENRAWAQTNWMLARIWKGDGFAFRYRHLPHLMPAKTQTQEIGQASLQEPCPSHLLQNLMQELLTEDYDLAKSFLDTLLNQLNWAFSEFIGMLQELQQITTRGDRAIIDSRQLKICATCFDITVSLLRVLELVANLRPQLFTDPERPAAEVLLSRLFQLLCQVLNRVTAKANLFENVVSSGLPGLESVDHFPIVTAVTGIILCLTQLKGSSDSQLRALHYLVKEPTFQQDSFDFVLGSNQATVGACAAAPPTGKKEKKPFSLQNYNEVTSEEVEVVQDLLDRLRAEGQHKRSSIVSVQDEDLCPICYANPLTVTFRPCGHQSCRACITYQLMQKNECFFCKMKVHEAVDENGKVLQL